MDGVPVSGLLGELDTTYHWVRIREASFSGNSLCRLTATMVASSAPSQDR